jgi:hypothetical protein
MRFRGRKTEHYMRRFCVVALFCFAFIPTFLFAQTADTLPIAKTISIADPEVAYGDIILHDPATNLYRISQGVNDHRVYGVAVENPTLLLETDATLVPIAERGRLFVNVTLEGGDIAVGDPIITSSVFGKGMRAASRDMNIVGFALEPFTAEDGVVTELEDGRSVVLGTILVDVGSRRALAAIVPPVEETANPPYANGQTVARFSFAALVALGSMALTFLTFLLSIRQGVISVGRNPLAKASIRSMVILNIILALIVSTVGIFFAVSILVAPL